MNTPGSTPSIGAFTVIDTLGSGGMGTVYLCRTPAGQRLAVKVVREDLTGHSEIRQRFAREVAALREVHSPYTVPVYAAETDVPPLWLATRYVEGPTLAARVRDTGPLSAEPVARLGLMLAEALATVHARGVIHRDVKPGNIIMEGDEPRLIDFGIARSIVDVGGLTAPGTIIGTSGYMAPEQLAGGRPSPAVDVFALGAVLTFAATGRPPFGTGSDANRRIRRAEPPRLDGVPAGLKDLIGACLAREPGARPGPRDLLTTLATLLKTAQEPTRPGGAAERAGRGEPTEPEMRSAHRCRTPAPGGACALRPAAAGLLDAGLTPALIRKALRDAH
ncbi:serine/threonine-protein kinase [Streptomyces sp. JHA26]|uniref:serine/threonine-protein kinase n=1 Tax=Streptomyces sp. JHA26 TaxID=1917143 RepID=UPI00098BBCAC|nr:serine/threonine-protein kinase [Streptomyces sp. JHA26]